MYTLKLTPEEIGTLSAILHSKRWEYSRDPKLYEGELSYTDAILQKARAAKWTPEEE